MENESTVAVESSQDSTAQSDSSSQSASENQPTQAVSDQIVELESLPKFKFGGREWTPKDLQGAYMMNSDYTRKTMALAEERKYVDNLRADLEHVRNNPSLEELFKSRYPRQYHQYLDLVLPANRNQGQGRNQGIDPQFLDRFQRLETEIQETKVNAILAELDAKAAVLSKKYPFADEEAVLSRAQSLVDRGEKVTDGIWEALWRTVHERNQKAWESFQAQRVNEQRRVNKSGKDVGSGGGTPGVAPRKAKTIKEATEMALSDLTNGQFV